MLIFVIWHEKDNRIFDERMIVLVFTGVKLITSLFSILVLNTGKNAGLVKKAIQKLSRSNMEGGPVRTLLPGELGQ